MIGGPMETRDSSFFWNVWFEISVAWSEHVFFIVLPFDSESRTFETDTDWYQ